MPQMPAARRARPRKSWHSQNPEVIDRTLGKTGFRSPFWVTEFRPWAMNSVPLTLLRVSGPFAMH